MKYHTELNIHKRRKFIISIWIFVILLVLAAIAASLYGYYAVINQQNENTEASSTSEVTSSYYASSVKVFKSPYFQIQLDKAWSEIPQESTKDKFVYRSLRANLVEDELIIYVNNTPANVAANRVLPVNLKGESQLLPINVSEHCIKSAGGSSANNKIVNLDRTSFPCDSDSTNYTVLVGLVGGSSNLSLKRPDGSKMNYVIYYSNLRATPTSSQIVNIVENFQTR